jgi:hypothetical protein
MERERAQPPKPGGDRNALEDACAPSESRCATESRAEQRERTSHSDRRCCAVRRPAILAPARSRARADHGRRRNAGEDRDRAEVMQLPAARWHDRSRSTASGLYGRWEAGHGIGDEHPRADQPHTSRENHRRDHRGPHRLSRALRKALRRDAIQRTHDDEVRALRPALATRSERTDRMPPPVIPGSPRTHRRERGHEQRTRHDAAGGLPSDRPSALVR